MSVSRSKYRPLSLQTCHSHWSPSYMVSILWSIQLWSISRGIPETTLAKPSSCPSMGPQGQEKTMSPALLLRKCLKKEWKVDLFTSYLLQKSSHILRWWQCTKYSIYFHSCNFNILSVTHVFKTVYPHIIFQLKKWIVIIRLICNSVWYWIDHGTPFIFCKYIKIHVLIIRFTDIQSMLTIFTGQATRHDRACCKGVSTLPVHHRRDG